MNMDYITIGCSPANEDCVQVGSENYHENAMGECRRFRELIRKELGQEPHGAWLRIKGFPHDFGTYLEVICVLDTNDETAIEYAFNAEGNAPTRWEG